MNVTAEHDRRHVWHPFTQMRAWDAGDPVVIAKPYGTWALAAPENTWSRSDRASRAQSIEIVEAF